jgi:uncharacterized membrane protein
MRFDWRLELPHWLLLGGMFALTAVVWPLVPERIPVHWNLAGQVDRYGGKFEGLALTPLLALAVYLLLLFLPRLDPLRANYDRFAGTYALLRLGVTAVLAGIHVVLVLTALGRPVDAGQAISLLVGGLFLLLGSLLPRLQPNWFAGIRTPWTLSSRLSWRKTHQVGAYYFVALGLAIIVAGVSRVDWLLWLTIVLGLTGVVCLFAYSYLVWRSDPERGDGRRE